MPWEKPQHQAQAVTGQQVQNAEREAGFRRAVQHPDQHHARGRTARKRSARCRTLRPPDGDTPSRCGVGRGRCVQGRQFGGRRRFRCHRKVPGRGAGHSPEGEVFGRWQTLAHKHRRNSARRPPPNPVVSDGETAGDSIGVNQDRHRFVSQERLQFGGRQLSLEHAAHAPFPGARLTDPHHLGEIRGGAPPSSLGTSTARTAPGSKRRSSRSRTPVSEMSSIVAAQLLRPAWSGRHVAARSAG